MKNYCHERERWLRYYQQAAARLRGIEDRSTHVTGSRRDAHEEERFQADWDRSCWASAYNEHISTCSICKNAGHAPFPG